MSVLEIINELRRHNVLPMVDGEHLRLSGETDRLSKKLISQIKKSKHELIDFLNGPSEQSFSKPIVKIQKQESYRVSRAQKRLWAVSQFEGGNEAYNIVTSLYLKGNVIPENLDKAFKICIERHESLKTVFKNVKGEPRQYILDKSSFSIRFKDISQDIEIKSFLKLQIEQSSKWKFDLEKGPLLRVDLFKLSESSHAMIFGIHHIISDGWSINIMIKEVLNYYEALCKKIPYDLKPLRIHYKEYTAWLETMYSEKKNSEAKNFWKTELENTMSVLSMPYDFVRPEINNFQGSVLKFYFKDTLYENIIKFCKKNHLTLFNFFRSAINILLSKYSGETNIVVGIPVSGRTHFDLENQIGLFINTLPLLTKVVGDQSFSEFVQITSKKSFEAFQYQDYPLENIIEDLEIQRNPSRNPLFDVMMVLQDTAIGGRGFNENGKCGFELSYLHKYLNNSEQNEEHGRPAKYDLTFNIDSEPGNKHFVEIEYSTQLYRKRTIVKLFNVFENILNQVLETPEIKIKSIQIANQEEKNKILKVFNKPIVKTKEINLFELFNSSFGLYKDKTAIIFDKKKISYAELENNVNKVNYYLENSENKISDGNVGLLLDRTEWIIFSILGILKTGMAYVPIDINYPDERIEFILDDSLPSCIIVDDLGKLRLPKNYKGRIIHLNDFIDSGYHKKSNSNKFLNEKVAYIIYTSGSTGKPKGVQIGKRNTISFLKWCLEEFADTGYDILYAGTSYCFDLSIFELFFPLVQGKTIRLLKSGLQIPEFIMKDKRVLINTVPSVVRNLFEIKMNWSNVVALNMAGEEIPVSLVKKLNNLELEIRNLYGPTEDTTYSTVYKLNKREESNIPIGKPIHNTQIYILDTFHNLLPVGICGEIYLGGEGVALGYLNRPNLTTQKFIDNPFISDTKMYRTGDMGRWSSNGDIQFDGRIDDQVKIRGNRIELGEIQYHLEKYKGVKKAVILLEGHTEKHLCAYWEGNSELAVSAIKEYLFQNLPSYMIPDFYYRLDKIPLTSNGKIDKIQLKNKFPTEKREYKEPRNLIEKEVLKIWKDVLGDKIFGIDENFFDLGGHSLKATKLKYLIQTKFKKEVTLNEIFSFPTVERLSEIIESKKSKKVLNVPKASLLTNKFPISLSQERLWVLTNFEEASRAYNMPAAFMISGDLRLDILQKAFILLIEQHEILRTVFVESDNNRIQKVLPTSEIDFKVDEIVFEEEISSMKFEEYLQKKWSKEFDLKNGPLLECFILKTPKVQFFSFNMHHIISDGWSLDVIYKAVIFKYKKLLQDPTYVSPNLSFQFKDYAVWQKSMIKTKNVEKSLSFWKNIFNNNIPVLELPFDFNRPEVKTYNGNTIIHQFDSSFNNKLNRLAKSNNSSMFMTLMAAVNILLKKYTNQNQIVIGTPIAGREYAELENQIGLYVNTLPIMTVIDSKLPFSKFLAKQKETILRCFEHQNIPFEMLINQISPERDLSRSPLFDVMVVFQNISDLDNKKQIEGDLYFKRIPVRNKISKYDCTFSFSEEQNELVLELEYNTDLFKSDTISRMIGHFKVLFSKIFSNPEIKIKDISLLLDDELEAISVNSDRTHIGYDQSATIVGLFGEAVSKHRNKIAIKHGNDSLTYQELDVKSDYLAKILVENYHVKNEDLICLHFERTTWMIVGIFAVLKAGAAYVPIDPTYPDTRINYILEDSKSQLLIFDSQPVAEVKSNWTSISFLDIKNLDFSDEGKISSKIKPSNLAYVIYTSGTTGNPKGVLIEHSNVTRLLFNDDKKYDFNSKDCWPLFHSYCFDVSVWEIFGALLNGGTLIVLSKSIVQDSILFYDFLLDNNVTVLNQTPTAFRSLVQNNRKRFRSHPLKSIRYLIFAGESLKPEILKEWIEFMPSCKIVNMYGITETTVHVTYKEISKKEIVNNKSLIGHPLPTLSLYILDSDLQQVPFGVIGELCVGGAGLARGYLNRIELTKEKFIKHPYKRSEKLYRSGDYARILLNGEIEYLGRKDDQVKIRGHRVEVAEIESVISKLDDIKDIVVVVLKNQNKEYDLAAYYILKKEINVHDLRLILKQLLPMYMVPSYLIPIDFFPLNRNGKLDKKKLPNPNFTSKKVSGYLPPRNEIDEQIKIVWENVLEIKNIGISDNFFDLGGHSLKATRVISRLHEIFGIKIDLKDLFYDPTIRHLSDYIEAIQWTESNNQAVSTNKDEIIF